MRHRIPQQLATGGLIGGSPMAIATGGMLAPRNRFRFVETSKTGDGLSVTAYRVDFESTTDVRDGELVEGEYVDDLSVLGGTAV